MLRSLWHSLVHQAMETETQPTMSTRQTAAQLGKPGLQALLLAPCQSAQFPARPQI